MKDVKVKASSYNHLHISYVGNFSLLNIICTKATYEN